MYEIYMGTIEEPIATFAEMWQVEAWLRLDAICSPHRVPVVVVMHEGQEIYRG